MELLVKFRGGPCDGHSCSSQSGDRIVAATALVWSLIALGRPTSAMIPGIVSRLRQGQPQDDWRTAVYEVALRTIKANAMTSEAIYC